ncbi:MAG TPA: response regulator [Verrucomicrobiae bacterium]
MDLLLTALAGQHFPHDAIVVYEGREALDYLYGREKFEGRDNGQPMLVLLDLKMPGVDGFEVLRQLKSDDGLKRIPVVIFSSSDNEDDVRRSYELGANAFITKPTKYDRFLEVVQGVISFWTNINVPPPVASSALREAPPVEILAA